MKNKWHALAFLIVLLVGIWEISGLWRQAGLPTSHDSISHMARMYAYEEGLKDGIFPVLWARRLFWGIGSPVLMLSYQIPYYFTMLWRATGLNLDDSFKAVLTFSQITSGILMYLALKNRFRTLPSLVGAILYMVAPYRLLNIYVRGALGEVFATMFPPLILWGIWSKSMLLQSFGWSGLFLSHPVRSAIDSGIFFGYVLVENQFKQIIPTLKKFFVPYGLALMIAAFNLLPTLALTKYTYYTPSDSDTLHHFPTFHQLIYSNWGFGFSTDNDLDQMSFQIGVIQWSLLLISVIVVIKKYKSQNSHNMLIYLSLVFVISVLLMIKDLATPIYLHLGLTKIIDFPWRILMVFSLLTALMAANLVEMTQSVKLKIFLAMFLVMGTLYTNRNHIRINATWPWPSDSFQHGTGDAFGEYAAKYRQTREGSQFYEISEFIQGEGKITILKDISNETKIRVESNSKGVVRLNSMYFPGWRARINGVLVPIDTSQTKDSLLSPCYVTIRQAKHIDDSGLVACHFVPGTHEMDLKYEALPIQKIGNLITLSGIGIFLWILCRSFYPRTTKPRR